MLLDEQRHGRVCNPAFITRATGCTSDLDADTHVPFRKTKLAAGGRDCPSCAPNLTISPLSVVCETSRPRDHRTLTCFFDIDRNPRTDRRTHKKVQKESRRRKRKRKPDNDTRQRTLVGLENLPLASQQTGSLLRPFECTHGSGMPPTEGAMLSYSASRSRYTYTPDATYPSVPARAGFAVIEA